MDPIVTAASGASSFRARVPRGELMRSEAPEGNRFELWEPAEGL